MIRPLARALHGLLALWVSCALAAPRLSQAPPLDSQESTDQVLAAARQALGWDELAADQVVRVVGAARLLGTDATQTIHFDGRGRYLQEFDGPLAQSNGNDGRTHWSRDWNDTARELVLGDLAGDEVAALLLCGGWSRPAGRLVFERVTATAGEIQLHFQHADGITAGTIRLDAGTHLPRSATFGFDEGESQWTFSGWQDHDGLTFPRRIELSQIGLTQSLDTRSVVRLKAVPADLFAPRLDAPDDTRFDPEGDPELELKRVASGHLLVHPTLDGADLGWFLFDSGAGTHCISSTVAEALAEGPFGEIQARGVGGSVPARFWRADELRLGPLTITGQVFMQLDLDFLQGLFGVPVGGILGYELLARCVAELDVGEPSIALHDPAHYALDPDGRWEPVLLYNRHPCVRAAFEGHEGLFKIDTGAAGDTVTLHHPAVEALGLLEGRPTRTSRAGGVGGLVATRTGRLASFRLGGHEFTALPASFALEDTGAFGDDYVLGNIGGKLLEPFLLVFDVPHGRLGFVPH